MQTHFSAEQIGDPALEEANRILRACVHCGFCTATCPTYVLLGDERDGPRGRIYMIKTMLESGKPASPGVVPHIDRCLSCLSCMTTCPSGVNYMHLVDHARRHIAETFHRPWRERATRALLAYVLPRRLAFRLALLGAWLAKPFAGLLPRDAAAMMALAPGRPRKPSPVDRPQTFPADGERRKRVALLNGCVQRDLAPEINAATVRLLTRHGCEVVVAAGAGCCGAITHHLGREAAAHASVKANIVAWEREIEGEGLDAILANASGCGTMLKDYGFMLRQEPEWAERAARVAALARDISEVMHELGLQAPGAAPALKVAHHSACSLQHGQKITAQPKALLEDAGFTVLDVPEGHLCCGSAGTYNVLQPEIADRLLERKVANIARLEPDVIAAGNIGCIVQIARASRTPIVHTVELLDWATGGPKPEALGP